MDMQRKLLFCMKLESLSEISKQLGITRPMFYLMTAPLAFNEDKLEN
jgi:hypothetical protein